MDVDLDPLTQEYAIIQTVEADAHTHNASGLTYNNLVGRRNSFNPSSSQALPASSAVLLDSTGRTPRSSFSTTSGHDSTHDDSHSPAYTSAYIYRSQAVLVPVVVPPARYKFLPYATSRSGVVYDVRMLLHRHLRDQHPENPSRISAVWQALQEGGLVSRAGEDANDFQLIRLPCRPATQDEICLVHTQSHFEWVRELPSISLQELKAQTRILEARDSIYVHPNTLLAALIAAGGAVDATKSVVTGQVRNAVAVIRPPGHHAEHDHASGFCFFNNVAIAAKVVQKEYPEQCRKVLILDWDVHHGNGIQHAFENDPNILYISLHVHEGGNFYPHGSDGDHLHCGTGKGLGKNINIPWPIKGMGDADYLYAFQQIVMPVAIEFNPDLVLISAGFDAADGDALGGCFVSPAGYSHMTHMLMQLAKGKVVACLEGGYGFESMGRFNPAPVAKSTLAVTRTLMGEPPERLGDLDLHQSAVKTVRTVIQVQSRYWQSLYPKSLDMERKIRLGSERLHDIIRQWQSHKFWEDYRMSALFIMREKLSKSFENQVLATPNYYEARPLLVIFHDPPEALGFPDPCTSQLELHNTWITYVDWAVKHEFAVIDVNIPRFLTETVDISSFEEAEREAKRARATVDVANYLWQNYIEPGDSTHIFLFGVGDAYAGIIELLSKHDTASESVTHTFNFVTDINPLRRVERPGDEGTVNVNRYYRRSSVFVSPEHLIWEMTQKKPSKKLGRLVRSSETVLQDMLLAHRPEVTETLVRLTQNFRTENGPKSVVQSSAAIGDIPAKLHPVTDGGNGHILEPAEEGRGLDKDLVMSDNTPDELQLERIRIPQ